MPLGCVLSRMHLRGLLKEIVVSHTKKILWCPSFGGSSFPTFLEFQTFLSAKNKEFLLLRARTRNGETGVGQGVTA